MWSDVGLPVARAGRTAKPATQAHRVVHGVERADLVLGAGSRRKLVPLLGVEDHGVPARIAELQRRVGRPGQPAARSPSFGASAGGPRAPAPTGSAGPLPAALSASARAGCSGASAAVRSAAASGGPRAGRAPLPFRRRSQVSLLGPLLDSGGRVAGRSGAGVEAGSARALGEAPLGVPRVETLEVGPTPQGEGLAHPAAEGLVDLLLGDRLEVVPLDDDPVSACRSRPRGPVARWPR